MNTTYAATRHEVGTVTVCGPFVRDYWRAHDYARAGASAELEARERHAHLQQSPWPSFGVAEFVVLSHDAHGRPDQVRLVRYEVTVEALLNK